MKNCNEMVNSLLERREQYETKKKNKRKMLTRTITLLCCICLVALLGIGFRQGDMFNTNEVGSSDYAVNDEKEKEALSASEIENTSDFTENNTSSVTTDAPVQDENGGAEALSLFDEVWGGSYMDSDGHWIVWLTEDTSENRAEVLKRNPTISQSNTEFKVAEYSLAYLTQLMTDISDAMMNNSFQFVFEASLREDMNRVVVTMTNTDESEVKKVLAFDTLGGAIEIVTNTEINSSDSQKEIQITPAE